MIGFLLYHIGYYFGFVCNFIPFFGYHNPNSGQFPTINTFSPKIVNTYAEK